MRFKTWTKGLHTHPSISISLFFLTAITMAWIVTGPVASFDYFWHVGLGRDLVENGKLPTTDHYSFTFAEQKVALTPIPFEVAGYYFTEVFGLKPGIKAFKFLLWIIPLFLFYFFSGMRRLSNPFQLALLGALISGLVTNYGLRPGGMSFSFGLALLFLLDWAKTENYHFKSLALIGILTTIWLNFHSSGILAYLLIGGYFLDHVINLYYSSQLKPAVFYKLGAAFLVFFALGFLNISFSHPLFGFLNFDDGWRHHIAEFRSRDFLKESPIYRVVWPISALIIYALFRLKRFGSIIIVAFFAFQALNVGKMMGYFIIFSLPFAVVAAFEIQNLLSRHQIRPGIKLFASICYAFLIAIFIYIPGKRAYFNKKYESQSNQMYSYNYPDQITQYMKKNGMQGNILNDYNAGGFLIYELGGHNKLFIDGRTNILYPLEHMKYYNKVSSSYDEFQKAIEKYQIDYVLSSIVGAPGILLNAHKDPRFSVAYVQGPWILMSKKPIDKKFELTSKILFQPECLKKKHLKKIIPEFEQAKAELPSSSTISEYLNMVTGYLLSPDRNRFLRDSFNVKGLSDFTLRLGSSLALKEKNDLQALVYIERIKKWSYEDYLRGAAILERHGQPQAAVNLLRAIKQAAPVNRWSLQAKNAFLTLLKKFGLEYKLKPEIRESFEKEIKEGKKRGKLDDCDY